MVGMVIALVATAVIYQTFSVAEGVRRTTRAVADAQQNGLISTFTLGVELANAGNAVSLAAPELDACPAEDDYKKTLRPIPVLIAAGNTSDPDPKKRSDAFVVNYSTTRTVVVPAIFLAEAPAPNQFIVQSPNGFAVGNRVIAVNQAAGKCKAATITARNPVQPPPTPPTNSGRITVTVDSNAAADFMLPENVDSYRLLDMGPAGGLQRVRYDLEDEVLRSTDLANPAAAPVPLASNVVLMKAQYGIDTSDPPDNTVDQWIEAKDGSGFAQQDVLKFSLAQLMRIKAIRIGVVVRSEQFDRDLTNVTPWTLFEGSLAGELPANWRYRTYETVIPLRNQLYNGAT